MEDKDSNGTSEHELSPQTQTPDIPPDGGAKAWLTTFGGFLVALVTFGYTNAFGVYQDVYTRQGAASPSAISWIGSTQLFFLLAMGLPGGKLLDMGHFRWTILVGSVVYVFGLFMLSIAHPSSYYQIYLSQGLCVGLSSGILYVPAVAVQGHHWHRHRALAMGIVVMGSSIGGVIFPIMLNQLLAHGVEFGWAVRYTAFVVLAALIVANLVMTDRRAVGSRAAKPDIKKILGNAPYLLTVVGVFFVDLGITFPYFYLQLFSVTKGVDRNIAFYALAIINAASLPGRIIPNIIADRVGPYNVLVTCTVICGAIIFAMFGIKNIAGMVVFAVFYGFFSGAFLGLFAPAVASLSDAPSEIGVRLGIAYFLTGFGTLVGPPIDGALVGHELLELEWPGAIIFSAVTMLGGGFLLLVARQILVKRKGTQQV